MRKTSRKLIRRGIKDTITRYLSIMGIVALGAGFLAGLLVTTPNMKSNAEKYFDSHNTFDVQIVSPVGFTEDEIKKLSEEKNIIRAEGSYSIDLILKDKNELQESRVIGRDFNKKNQFNEFTLTEGRLPDKSNECVVVIVNPYAHNYAIGDPLSISNENLNYMQTDSGLKESEFKIVGIAQSPIFIKAEGEATNIGDGSIDLGVYVKDSVFNLSVYTKANVALTGANKLDSFKEEYESLTKKEAEKIEALGEDKEWQVFTREDNQGINTFKADVEKVGAISRVFPVFFFLIAALVALTTMTRLIEEERSKIGALKAMGYGNKDIIKNYFIYSISASVLGAAIGLAVGLNVLPRVINNAYNMMYSLPPLNDTFIWNIGIVVSLTIIFLILFATYMALRSTLNEVPAGLLVPKAPKEGKRILLERIRPVWKRIKFTRKVTLRNLFRYKKRFLMTIIGIAGCFALLVTGFGMRDSIGDIVDKQYNQIYRYDYVMGVKTEEGIRSSATLNNKDKVSDFLTFGSQAVDVKSDEKSMEVIVLSPSDQEKIDDFIRLKDKKTKEKISFNEDSVILTAKLAEELEVSEGDKVSIGREKKLKVTAITENYVGSYIYLGKNAFEDNFGIEKEYTYILVSSKKAGLEEDFLKEDNTKYIVPSETVKDNFRDSIKSIDYIVVVLIVSAGALAVIVLYNLTNVNICERKKELGTIKVLGFYDKETYSYIFKEVNILAALGILFGIPSGILLHKFVIWAAEVSDIMFGRHIYFTSYLYSALITIVLTILINLLSRREIKKIDMVESTKANE